MSGSPAEAATGWLSQKSGTSQRLYEVSCPDALHCWAVGDVLPVGGDEGSVLIATADGGNTWSSQTSGTTKGLYAITCYDDARCWAGGANGVLLSTSDGGVTWSKQTPSTQWTYGLACPDGSHCWAVGGSGGVLTSANGGSSWTPEATGIGSNVDLNSISCPDASHCVIVGGDYTNLTGIIARTADGGATWSVQTTTHLLRGVACPDASRCWAVGYSGTVLSTSNGGASWSTQPSNTTEILNGVSCPDASHCWVVGNFGLLISTSNGGATWGAETSGASYHLWKVSCPHVANCSAVSWDGTIVARRADSRDCSGSAGTFDGYLSSTYVRFRPQRLSDTETWVCVRAHSGSALNTGGLFVATGPAVSPPSPSAPAPAEDSNGSACSTTPGNTIPGPHPGLSGAFGDPSDPFYTQFAIDTYSDGSQAWTCGTLGPISSRIVIPFAGARVGGAAPPAAAFFADAGSISDPPRQSWPSGNPSSSCQTGSTGTFQELVNADVGTSHLWLGERQVSSTKVQLCTRVQGGGTDRGGLLTIDGGSTTVNPNLDLSGVPGIGPVLNPFPDSSACPRVVASLASPVQLQVGRSNDGANPASVCIDLNGSHAGITAGTTGSPKLPGANPQIGGAPPSVTWTPDPGTPG